MIIYCTTNLITFEKYIGYDTNNNPSYLGSGIRFKNALRKYGRENFKKQILEYCNSFDGLLEAEIYWIDYFNAQKSDLFYNIASGGAGARKGSVPYMKGKRATEEHRLKNSKAKLGKNNPRFNPNVPEEIRVRRRFYRDRTKQLKNTGTKPSLVRPKRTREQRKRNGELHSKPIVQLHKITQCYIATFQSAVAASKILEFKDSSGISSVCTGRLKSTGGFKWMYESEYDKLLKKAV